MEETLRKTKAASRILATISDEKRNEILLAVADAIISNKDRILKANADDLAKMDPKNPLYDRLQLTDKRLDDIASDMRNVSRLPSPLGRVLKESTLPNGLRLKRVSVPFGVIGMIYEARPNVTFDVFSLCFKSGNACVLKGGKDADCSNREEVALIHEVLANYGVPTDIVALLPATHEATAEMLNAVGYIDVCIPRGGRRLIDFVRDNAKTRRVSVCNALDCLIIHRSRLADLDQLIEPVLKKGVKTYYGEYGTEFMDYKMSIKVVDSIDEALDHIATYDSGHSECIITENEANARKFQQMVDAACVYVNAPTSFTDGAQFGLGAEIGISTQKLGPRGPMGLEEITTYKWLIEGEGQVRN